MTNLFEGLLKRFTKRGLMKDEAETAAAIAAALARYDEGMVHDYESYIITIKRK